VRELLPQAAPRPPLSPEAPATAAAHLHAAEEALSVRLLSGCGAQAAAALTHVEQAESVLEQQHQPRSAGLLQQTASVLQRWVSAVTTPQHLGEPLQAHCALLRVRSLRPR
jgi:hypothetical protein